ncbi:MAG: HNH endonuclease signature motif containing protein [Candidatus Peregrinibacteria bacterium]|nr:HNH endonuclease signature motif containing protein [Candidatus Peregrinibacteria bacterium]
MKNAATKNSDIATLQTTPINLKRKIDSDVENFSDIQLMCLCKEYGENAIRFRRKFIGLLPEVKKRKLFEKKKCKSIYEFAAKYGGVSREHVDRVVNLSDRFIEKPLLRKILVNGEVSSNKLARIASIVDLIDEIDLVEAVTKLACRTVETYVRDVKSRFGVKHDFDENSFDFDEKSSEAKTKNGSLEPLNDPKSVHVHKSYVEINTAISQIDVGLREALPTKKLQLKLSEETLENLLELQARGISIDDLFREFLQKCKEDLAENKAKVVANEDAKEAKRKMDGKAANRRLSVGVKKVLKQEFGDRCSVSSCTKKSVHIHHKVPFAISGSHDPHLLAPLCREHHDIVHSINLKYVEKKL